MKLLLRIGSALLIGMTVLGLMRGVWLHIPIPVATIANEKRFAYRIVLYELWYLRFTSPGYSTKRPYRATMQLFENGQLLGPPHSLRDAIRSEGQGRFAHWGSRLYFSTSDNSDPRTNGRFYKLVTRAKLPSWLWGVLGSCFLIPFYLTRAPRPHIGLWLALPPILTANAGAKTVEPGITFPRGSSRSMGLTTWIMAMGMLLGLYPVVLFVYSNSRTAPPTWDFLLLVGRASLPCLWPVGLIATCAFVWRAGRHIGALGPDFVDYWWNRALTWHMVQRIASMSRKFAGLSYFLTLKWVCDCIDTVDRVLSATPGWLGCLLRIAGLMVPFVVYGVILNVPLPSKLLFAAYYSLTAIAIPAFLVLYLVYRQPGWLGTIASLTLTLSLFSLPLLALWSHIGIQWFAVGELLPFSDSSGYYYDARRLLDGQLLGWSARRPLFVGMLATLLGLTGQNLQVTLAIFVAVNAVACFLLAREIQVSHGTMAAVIVIMLLFFFYRSDGTLGSTLTENLGLPLGIISFAVLWRGAREWRTGSVWLGLGLLTLALAARAGAFFVLPALMFGGAWIFRGQARCSLGFLAGAATVIALGFGLNLVLGKMLADPTSQQTAFSNFSYTLYGLVVGGKGWGQVLMDYPAAREGAEIYALAWQAFCANPMGLVIGSLKMWREYFPPQSFHAFAFIRDDSYAESMQMACYVLSALGLAQCVRRYQQPHYFLLAAAAIGHLASIPFAPPIDGGLRVYAATTPILAILVAIAAGGLAHIEMRLLGPTRLLNPMTAPAVGWPPGVLWRGASIAFGLVLTTCAIIGPLVIHMVSHASRFAESSCPAGQETVYVRLSPGAFLRIVDDMHDVASKRIIVPEIRVKDLQKTAGTLEIKNDMDRFVAGNTMMNTYDLKSGRYLWLITPTYLLSEPLGIVRICGYDSANAQSKNYGVFYAASVHRVAWH